jgi:hypothetical protein
MKRNAIWIAAVCLPLGAWAQSTGQPQNIQREIRIETTGGGTINALGPLPAADVAPGMFFFKFDANPVKGAPYAAENSTESTQTLPDGNRIVNRNTSKVWRDSEGRTRNEAELKAVGSFAPAGEPRRLITIFDPVAGVHYTLDPQDKTAMKMPLPSGRMTTGSSADARIVEDVRVIRKDGSATGTAASADTVDVHGPVVVSESIVMAEPTGLGSPGLTGMAMGHAMPGQDAKSEALGQKTIEGLICDGTRTTVTIPAGAIGNEQAINTVTETWTSTELKADVLRKHSDPRFGETVYKMTNVQRGEQPRSLFEAPSDYKIEDMSKLATATTTTGRDVKVIRHEEKK